MVVNYKCPNCGAAMTYDEGTDSLVCDYCNTKLKVSEIQETQNESVEDQVETSPEYMEFHGYKCPNCGAEIVTDDQTAATFCGFCGSPTLLEDRLSGVQKPNQVLPFKFDKNKAVELFNAWTKKGIFTPGEFHSKAAIEKITGIYVPFWLYDYDASVVYDARATRVRHQRRGDWEYTYTDHFLIHRKVYGQYEKIPADASEKMDDDMMDRLEPFDYGDMKDFDMKYLSGFYAEKYTYDQNQMAKRAETRVKDYGIRAARDTVVGYTTVVPLRQDVQMQRKKAEYVLMPVWMLNYSYKGKMYHFALNAQTEKMVGVLPVSKAKMGAWFGGIAAAGFLLLNLFNAFV